MKIFTSNHQNEIVIRKSLLRAQAEKFSIYQYAKISKKNLVWLIEIKKISRPRFEYPGCHTRNNIRALYPIY